MIPPTHPKFKDYVDELGKHEWYLRACDERQINEFCELIEHKILNKQQTR